jgi:hypothetical protein
MNTRPSSNDDDSLEALLKSQHESIPDDGFSARVLAALPEPRPARLSPVRRQRVLVALATLAGLAVAFLRSGFSPAVELQKAGQSIDEVARTLAGLNTPMFWTSMFTILVSLYLAFQQDIVRALKSI